MRKQKRFFFAAACPARQWRSDDNTVLHLPRTPLGEMGFTMEVCVSGKSRTSFPQIQLL